MSEIPGPFLGPTRTWLWIWPPWPQGQFLRPWADPNQRFAYDLDGQWASRVGTIKPMNMQSF